MKINWVGGWVGVGGVKTKNTATIQSLSLKKETEKKTS